MQFKQYFEEQAGIIVKDVEKKDSNLYPLQYELKVTVEGIDFDVKLSYNLTHQTGSPDLDTFLIKFPSMSWWLFSTAVEPYYISLQMIKEELYKHKALYYKYLPPGLTPESLPEYFYKIVEMIRPYYQDPEKLKELKYDLSSKSKDMFGGMLHAT